MKIRNCVCNTCKKEFEHRGLGRTPHWCPACTKAHKLEMQRAYRDKMKKEDAPKKTEQHVCSGCLTPLRKTGKPGRPSQLCPTCQEKKGETLAEKMTRLATDHRKAILSKIAKVKESIARQQVELAGLECELRTVTSMIAANQQYLKDDGPQEKEANSKQIMKA